MEDFGVVAEGFRARRIQESDFDKGFLKLLTTLTRVGEVSRTTFVNTFREITKSPEIYCIIVLEEIKTGKLAGAGTLFIEQKFIRECGKAGHIEDIVISPDFQGKGLGKVLIKTLMNIGKQKKCYKVILDCSQKNEGFYKRCGFNTKGLQMAAYYNQPKL